MGSDPDVLRCRLNVKFPLHHPFAAPHHMAASNGSTYWCVYINNQKKISSPATPDNPKSQVYPTELQ